MSAEKSSLKHSLSRNKARAPPTFPESSWKSSFPVERPRRPIRKPQLNDAKIKTCYGCGESYENDATIDICDKCCFETPYGCLYCSWTGDAKCSACVGQADYTLDNSMS